jgi:hypothetical protein
MLAASVYSRSLGHCKAAVLGKEEALKSDYGIAMPMSPETLSTDQ